MKSNNPMRNGDLDLRSCPWWRVLAIAIIYRAAAIFRRRPMGNPPRVLESASIYLRTTRLGFHISTFRQRAGALFHNGLKALVRVYSERRGLRHGR